MAMHLVARGCSLALVVSAQFDVGNGCSSSAGLRINYPPCLVPLLELHMNPFALTKP